MSAKRQTADQVTQQYLRQARSSHNGRGISRLLPLPCGLVIVVLALALCFGPHKPFSEQENRLLQLPPIFSWSSLTDGTLSRRLSDFCSDQFPFRSRFIDAKARTELLLGKQENNGILLGQEGYLMARPAYGNETRQTLRQNAAYIERLQAALERRGVPFSFAAVPRTIDVNLPYLPPLYDPDNDGAVWDWLAEALTDQNLSPDVLLQPLQRAAAGGAPVYYKTDHHWTSLGAYTAYTALAPLLGYTPYPKDSFTEQTVSTDFVGTSASSFGLQSIEADIITRYRYAEDTARVTHILQNGTVTRTIAGLYDEDALGKKDQYSLFLGGTSAHIVVEPSDPTLKLPTLLLIKDSFSQSLAPFLSRHYRLVLIDPRSYPFEQLHLTELIEREQPAHVLLLYGIDTLTSSSLQLLTLGLADDLPQSPSHDTAIGGTN